MRDMSDLLKSTTSGFLGKLDLSKEQKNIIMDATRKIKDCLSDAIAKEYDIHPRYMTQGSAKYKTQNQPCWPSQEVDYDLGCYLPFSDLEETGKPYRAATVFFETVDNALENLAKKEQWKGICKEKNTCSRVLINKNIHMDIPLYSVPDKEFNTIKDFSETRKSLCSAEVYDSNIEEETWEDFDYDRVLLAHRKEGWQESDPRNVNKYFQTVFKMKGEQLRRICRYVKAWRDFKWKEGGPTSIYLMCLVEDLFKAENSFGDDIGLLEILEMMPERLRNPVVNKSEDEELKMKNPEDLPLLIDYARAFSHDLHKAIHESSISDDSACLLIQKHLGNRFPVVNHINSKSISGHIRSTPVNTGSSDMPLARVRVG